MTARCTGRNAKGTGPCVASAAPGFDTCARCGGRRKTRKLTGADIAKRPPTNSLGEPWVEGQSWTCTGCGATGPDRDDVRVPDSCQCIAPMRYEPPEHEAAIRARHPRPDATDATDDLPPPPASTDDPPRWNTRWLRHAEAHDVDPRSEIRPMDFSFWIKDRWAEWGALQVPPRRSYAGRLNEYDFHKSDGDHPAFDAWLLERTAQIVEARELRRKEADCAPRIVLDATPVQRAQHHMACAAMFDDGTMGRDLAPDVVLAKGCGHLLRGIVALLEWVNEEQPCTASNDPGIPDGSTEADTDAFIARRVALHRAEATAEAAKPKRSRKKRTDLASAHDHEQDPREDEPVMSPPEESELDDVMAAARSGALGPVRFADGSTSLPTQASLFGEEEGFACLSMDPPWAERGGGKIKRGADRHYDLAGKLGDIRPILRAIRDSGSFRPAANAHLWCWYTDTFLEDALVLVRELGFAYKRTFVWVKTSLGVECEGEHDEHVVTDDDLRMGIGQYGRGCHEGMIFATRGKGQHASVWTGDRSVRSVFHAPHPTDEHGKRIHSRKPPKSYELIERVSKGPRVEFFARTARPGWNVWGNQAPEVTP